MKTTFKSSQQEQEYVRQVEQTTMHGNEKVQVRCLQISEYKQISLDYNNKDNLIKHLKMFFKLWCSNLFLKNWTGME